MNEKNIGHDLKKPNFFIVGAPKCGTSSLYEYLREHPDIFMSEVKEPFYFCPDLGFHRYKNDQEYLTLFSKVDHETRIGEASTQYLYSKVAADKIYQFNPEARIVIMLRNPVDMMHSLHSFFFYWGVEDIEDFETALSVEENRKQGRCLPKGIEQYQSLFYREIAAFSGQVKRYLDIFGRESVHVIIFDDFVTDTLAEYRSLLSFLGVDSEFTPAVQIANPNKKLRSSSLQKLLREPPETVRSLVRKVVPSGIRHALVDSVRDWNTKHAKRAPMNQELRHRLNQEFLPDVEMLSTLLERDLTYWCKNE